MFVSRSIAVEINEGRGVGKEKDHVHLHLDHLDQNVIEEDYQVSQNHPDCLQMSM